MLMFALGCQKLASVDYFCSKSVAHASYEIETFFYTPYNVCAYKQAKFLRDGRARAGRGR